jgi:hypothetical protein
VLAQLAGTTTLPHHVRVLPGLAPALGMAVPSTELVSDKPTAILHRKLEGDRATSADSAWPTSR